MTRRVSGSSPALAARRLVDFSGPHGWEHSSFNLGRVEEIASAPCDGVSALQRRVLPLAELRADFEISRAELRDDDRGATDADLEPLDIAARRIAMAENIAVFHGWPEASIAGITELTPHQIELGERARQVPAAGRGGGRAAARQRHRGPVRAGARRRPVPARRPDRRERRLPAARAPAQDHRGPARLGPGRPRRGRDQPARRRLPLRLRPGPVDRLSRARSQRRAPVSRGELQLPRRDARGRGRADRRPAELVAPRDEAVALTPPGPLEPAAEPRYAPPITGEPHQGLIAIVPLFMLPVLMLLAPLLVRPPKSDAEPPDGDDGDDGGGGGGGPKRRKPDNPSTGPGGVPLPDAEQSRKRLRSHRLSRSPRTARRRTHEPPRQPVRSPSRVRTGLRSARGSRCGGVRQPR